ncbi:hypothetical protein [Kineosporia succinea]|uniref:Uncharacterized protein n=1 Tax=Kineosporia succinea TaxID=84632 RepID=A0ABT9PC69_9ACTN|nr:hypothetical protein [Kineosporia succinea]MDP9830283.1 hypothetical protein [Kineosporia succinea]
MSSPHDERPHRWGEDRPGGSRRWWWAGAVAAVAVAAGALLVVIVGRQDDTAGPGAPAAAAELPQHAVAGDENPHLFMKDARWRLTSLSQEDRRSGNQVLTLEGRTVSVSWYPSTVEDLVMSSHRADLREEEPLTIFGQRATVLADALTHEALFTSGTVFTTVRVQGVRTRDEFTTVLSDLTVLTPEQWEESLGEQVVPSARSGAVAKDMLRGVPVPDGFDPADLASEFTQDRSYFGTHVLGSVGCAWLDVYTRARADDDEKTMAEVDEPLSGHRNWPLQQEVSAGVESSASDLLLVSGKVATRQDATEYRDLLGCDR